MWDPDGSHVGSPCGPHMGFVLWPHLGPRWGSPGGKQDGSHVGPTWDQCGVFVGFLCGVGVGPIWAGPDGDDVGYIALVATANVDPNQGA